MILLITVAELPGLGDYSRLHRRLSKPKVSQRSQGEPPLLGKPDDGAQNSVSESVQVSDKIANVKCRLRDWVKF